MKRDERTMGEAESYADGYRAGFAAARDAAVREIARWYPQSQAAAAVAALQPPAEVRELTGLEERGA